MMTEVFELRITSYIFLVIFSILFLLSTLAGSIAWAVNATVLKPYHTNDLLKSSGIYADLSEMMRSSMINDTEPDIINKVLSDELEKTVTEEYVEQKLNTLQTQLWDYLTNQSPLNLQVDISEISDALTKAVNEQITDPDVQKSEVIQSIKESFPRSLDLTEMLSEDSSSFDFETVKSYYQLSQNITLGLYLSIFVLIVICTLLTLYLKNTSKWLGIVFLIAGIKILVLGILVRILPDYAPWNNESSALPENLLNVIANAASKISTQFIVIAVILLVISVALFLAKRYIPKLRKVQPATESV
jgi:hypothetical protein